MKINRLILIGLLFAGSLIVLIWGINFLSGKNFLQKEKEYFASYEKISGLMVSSPVTVKGFKVGDVRDISLSFENSHDIMVKFVITYPELKLPKGTIPRIYSTDLMGTKGIELILGDSLTDISYGDTLMGTIEGDLKDQVNTQMLPLKQKAEALMSSMDSVLLALQLVFDQENRSNLSQSFEIVAQTLKNFEQTSVFLDTFVKAESSQFSFIIDNLDSLSNNLVVRTNELKGTFSNIELFTDSLKQIPLKDAVNQFNGVLESITELVTQVNEGEGSLGKLVVNDSLYNSIENTSLSLNQLLEDIRKNPKRYVRVSAVDRGKTYFLSNDQEIIEALSQERDLQYYVIVHKSSVELEEDHAILEDFKKAFPILVNKVYYYCLLETTKYDKARRLVTKNISSYPDSGVFTWLSGKWTKIPN